MQLERWQREVELTIVSAQKLKNVNLWGGRMSPFAVAWIYPWMKYGTPTHTGGGGNPIWNDFVKLTCDESRVEQEGSVTVVVGVYHRGLTSNKLIGTATVDVVAYTPGAADKPTKFSSTAPVSMSVPVRRPSGRSHGVLNIAVKLGKVVSLPDPVLVVVGNSTFQNGGGGTTTTTTTTPVIAYPPTPAVAVGSQSVARATSSSDPPATRSSNSHQRIAPGMPYFYHPQPGVPYYPLFFCPVQAAAPEPPRNYVAAAAVFVGCFLAGLLLERALDFF